MVLHNLCNIKSKIWYYYVVLSCVFGLVSADTKESGTFDLFVDPDTWADSGFQLSTDAPEVLSQYIDSLGSKQLVAKSLAWLSIYAIGLLVTLNNRLNEGDTKLHLVGKINLPSTGFATKPPKCTGGELLTINSVS